MPAEIINNKKYGENASVMEIRENMKDWMSETGFVDRKLITHVKNVVMSHSDDAVMKSMGSSEQRKLNIKTFVFIVNEVCRISAEQLDNIWSAYTLREMRLGPLADEIKAAADDSIKEATLFSRKKIVLHECFPEYYAATYPKSYDTMDVIRAEGDVLKDLKKAGKPDLKKIYRDVFRTEKKFRRTGSDGGAIVDRIAYDSLSAYLRDAYGCQRIDERLELLSEAKALKINKLGICKVIESREIYPSMLDFYFLNSSEAAQNMFFDDYRELRAATQAEDGMGMMLEEYELA